MRPTISSPGSRITRRKDCMDRLKERIKKKDKRLYDALIFLIKFNILAIPMYLIIIFSLSFAPLQEATAQISTSLIPDSSVSGTMIVIPMEGGSWAADINWDCTGWKSMYALFALIFATPFALGKKLWGLLLIPLVCLINIFRIVFMFLFVKTYGLANYELVHATLWSWGLVAAILILWIVWIKFFKDWKLPGCGNKYKQPRQIELYGRF